jgi:hypothetical protein
MGMLGLVIADENGVLRTSGLNGSQSGTMTPDQLDRLVQTGHARRIEAPALGSLEIDRAALWVGHEFAEEADAQNLSIPPVPRQNSVEAESGTIWVAPTSHVWRVLDYWLVQAFRAVALVPDERVARLMSWVLPQRIETRAARWLTAKDTSARQREIEWSLRVQLGGGEDEVSSESLERKFRRRITEILKSTDEKVVGFSAPAKGGDKEVAAFIANRQSLKNVSFGAWLKSTSNILGHKDPKRRDLQELGQRIIDNHGELSLLLDVLDSSKVRPAQPFVLEGIRHEKVLESVRSLVGRDRFVLAYVDRPLADRKRLLREKEHLSTKEIDLVLNDPTELELPKIRKAAQIKLDIRKGAAVEGRRLLKEISSGALDTTSAALPA